MVCVRSAEEASLGRHTYLLLRVEREVAEQDLLGRAVLFPW